MAKYIIGIVVVVALAGGLVYWYTQRDEEVTISGGNTETSDSSDDNITGTFAELLALGQNVSCDYSSTEDTGTTSGDIYIKNRGEGIRANFVIKDEAGVETTSHVLVDDLVEYVWTDGVADGAKITLQEEDKTDLFSNEETSNLSPSESLTCKKWNVDEDQFDVPTDVNFVEIGAGLENPATTVAGKEEICNTCNSLEGELKQQCLTSFSCASQ